MPELIRHSADESQLRSTEVVIDRGKQETLGVGLSEGTVNRIKVIIFSDQGRSRQITMAEKIFDSHTFKGNRKEAIGKILDNHTELKARKFPVIPTMRVDRHDGKTLFMTDLTQNGENEVYSTPDWLQSEEGAGRKGKFEGSSEEVTISNPEEVSAELAKLFEKSFVEGCEINYPDAFFLVVNKQTKKAELIFGDILDLEFLDPKEMDAEEKEDFLSDNYVNFGLFIDEMNTHLAEENQLNKRPLALLYRSLKKGLRPPVAE